MNPKKIFYVHIARTRTTSNTIRHPVCVGIKFYLFLDIIVPARANDK